MKRFKAYTLEKGLIETNNFIDFDKLTLHRLDGPAFIKYLDNGNIEIEHYYINNIKHRLDGPASIYYDTHNNIVGSYYYINGVKHTKEEYNKELFRLKVQSL